jgi:hypothetical protein
VPDLVPDAAPQQQSTNFNRTGAIANADNFDQTNYERNMLSYEQLKAGTGLSQ